MNENNNSQSWSSNSSGIQENNNENKNTAVNDSNDDNNNNDNVTNTQQPVRKRTRATADQLSVLEDTFAVNVSPNSKLRKQLAEQLQMSERSIQIWFQNRRAKVKHMQKRAQMQMHQASIRAQLYQYHQQQQQQGYAQPMNYYYNPVTAVNYHHHHPSRILNAIPRAQSVDAIQHYHRQQQLFVPPPPPPPGISPSNYNPTMFYPAMDMSPISRQSMPPYDLNDIGLEFPEYLNGPSPSPSPIQPMKPSTIPTLIPVPDAGPTAVLATATTTTTTTNTNTTTKINNNNNDITDKRTSSVEDTWISSPDSSNNNDDKNNKNATSTDSSTVDPSNLVMTGKEQSTIIIEGDEEEEPKDLYLSATTLTIGTWHRLRMSETDLVCVYRPDTRTFAWHIVDGGCHFKMEVTQDAVSSIEYIVNGEHDALAEVHFDISEPPLFYMESTTVNTTIEEDPQDKKKRKASNASIITPVWVQCSDFTEGKQASRFFRHTLKGVQHHLKQELLALIQNHEETRRLVHFIEPPAPSAATAAAAAAAAANIYPMDYPTDIAGYLNPGVYWNNGGGIPITTSAGNTNGGTSSNNDLLSCGLYIS
ncbi:unnamed protein product [Rhizopus microsporus]